MSVTTLAKQLSHREIKNHKEFKLKANPVYTCNVQSFIFEKGPFSQRTYANIQFPFLTKRMLAAIRPITTPLFCGHTRCFNS